MEDFALIGAAGFIAPKHFKAITDTRNNLVAALDKNDSVGIIDRYFPKASFFTEFERFDRHLEKLRRAGHPINYLSICSPNYLHEAHIRFGLRNGANVICEKPVVLNPKNIVPLFHLEEESGKRVNTILQLRLHPSVQLLKQKIDRQPGIVHDVDLTYITPRGSWYYASWKGDEQKSGGIATNIGIHLFDLLIWLFGEVKTCIVHLREHDRAAGFLQMERARVRWFLSINEATLPQFQGEIQTSIRSLTMDGETVDFTNTNEDLITKMYGQILNGEGPGLNDALPSIELVQTIREKIPVGIKNDYHPLAALPLSKHPFCD